MAEMYNPRQSFYTIQTKPLIDISMVDLKKSLPESFLYSDSEFTGKIDELSPLSEIFKERFPRFSGASINIIETPANEYFGSFRDYIEIIDSPKNQLANQNTTPLDSPKQASFSISEIKDILSDSDKKCLNGSSEHCRNYGNLINSPYNRQGNVSKRSRKFFDNDLDYIKSLQTEPTNSPEIFRGKFCDEAQKSSCHCNSCRVM